MGYDIFIIFIITEINELIYSVGPLVPNFKFQVYIPLIYSA